MIGRPSWSMRFALALSAVFASGVTVAGMVSVATQNRALNAQLERDVRSLAESLAHVATSGEHDDLVEQIGALTRNSRNGTTLVGLVDLSTGEMTGNARPARDFEGLRRLTAGKDLFLAPPLRDDGGEVYVAYGLRTGAGLLMTARDTRVIDENTEVLTRALLWGMGAALAVSIALAVLIARHNERRIRRMEEVLGQVGAGKLDLRIHDDARDDLARLAAGVDRTLDRLAAGIETIRQVSTDVAHDLRAPLARLRMRIEPFATDPDLSPATRHAIGSTLAEIDDLSGTFAAILRLARLESGTVGLQLETVDLGDLAREVQDMLLPVAEDLGQTLDIEVPPSGPVVTGDRELLTQALINLVDNSLRHCPAPARILVHAAQGTVGLGTAGPVLEVLDNGPGIPAADRDRATERFVRLDDSRSTPGTGLGLSLVRAIAARHGATLTLADNRPGLRVTIGFAPAGMQQHPDTLT